MREIMPGFEELHIAKVGDGTYILRTDKQVVVTAQNFGQVVKKARSYFEAQEVQQEEKRKEAE